MADTFLTDEVGRKYRILDATLTCEACTNATCTKRGSRPAKDEVGRTIWRIPR